MKVDDRVVRRRLQVFGVVQGVGFRPHAARLANELQLGGWVRNDATGATVEIEGAPAAVVDFETRLVSDAPPLAQITEMQRTDVPPTTVGTFCIVASTVGKADAAAVLVAPDTAPCQACMGEFMDPANRRYRHPFITCTDCGPRWTIVTGLPYDRAHTTMASFDMCAACRREYVDPLDRRYHAQPIGCHDCGPRVQRVAGKRVSHRTAAPDRVIAATQQDLAAGRIVALKGLGGFHLAVDARNQAAITRLRRRKDRPDKPFAVMVPDLDAAKRIAHVSPREEALLASPARPIVLLRAHMSVQSELSPAVAPLSPFIGVMLPYTPLHHLLFTPVPGVDAQVPTVLVMTSGNLSGEPIVYEDAAAFTELGRLADSFCTHDRPISLPCDDSVLRIVDDAESPIRRGRGYAPISLLLPFSVQPTLAIGGDLKNTCAVASGRRVLISQHLGDMASPAACQAAKRTAAALAELHGITPLVTVTDRHPAYITRSLNPSRDTKSTLRVGHHHAHLASLMAEHGLGPSERLIGFLFDGTGWGDDDTLWGGEVVVGGYGEIDRRAHLRAIALPGGEAAVRNPWRTALAYLDAAGVDSADFACGHRGSNLERGVVAHQIATGLNSPKSTSMGRLFDAVASLLDVRHSISYEAQAAIDLEVLASSAAGPARQLCFGSAAGGVIDTVQLIQGLTDAILAGEDPAGLALSFHLAVADLIVEQTEMLVRSTSLDTVGLSGGVFHNDVLTRAATGRLKEVVSRVLTHRIVPTNDGGLALGQIAVAGYKLLETSEVS